MTAAYRKMVTPIECPSCGGKAELVQVPEAIPHFGEVLLTHLTCACGFKYNDVLSLEFRTPMRYEVVVETEADLRTKIVRSSSGTLTIPEMKVCIEPGPAAEGYFTNTEGLLDRVEQAIRIIRRSAEGKKAIEAARAALSTMEKARAGKFRFTVILEDPFGNSALIGDKVTHRPLSEKEARKLKTGIQQIDK